MKHIYESFERIAAVSGNAKHDLLVEELMNEDTLWAMKRALDPMRTYGVGKKTLKDTIKKLSGHGTKHASVQEAELLLERLQDRSLTGSAAKSELASFFTTYSEESWHVLTRIITKDPRAGMSGKSVNKALGRDEIVIFEVNLAHPYTVKRVKKWPVKVELKHDGVRTVCIADLGAKTATFLSRTGKEFHAFRTLSSDVISFLTAGLGVTNGVVVLDGEVITGDFLKTVSEVRRKGFDAKDAEYHIFEFMTEREFIAGCALPEERRRGRLESLYRRAAAVLGEEGMDGLAVKLIEQEIAHNDKEVRAKFKEKFEQGFEGIIVKQTHTLYERSRNAGYLKLKDEVETAGEVDLKIIDVYEGEGKYEGMAGGVVVDFNGVPVRIGGGFTDQQRAEIWADFKGVSVTYSITAWDEEQDEMTTVMKTVKPSQHKIIGRLVEVKYHEITEYGSMRHPRFHRFRDILNKGEIV